MRTFLPFRIDTVKEAKEFLTELHENNETFHPEDDAHDINWTTTEVSMEEKDRLNELMQNIYDLPCNKDKYPDLEFDPCDFLMELVRRDNPELFKDDEYQD
jgi:hypothetical protein